MSDGVMTFSQNMAPAAKFRHDAMRVSSSMLKEWVGTDRAHEATGRISAALAASAASARDPADFYACTIQSIGTCIAISALTGIMPGVGSTALAYVVPQRARKGEPPQLQYSLSHRGLNALARRCGQAMIAIPIGCRDGIEATEDGEVRVTSRDIDRPPLLFEELRGVVVVVKEIRGGMVLCRGWVPVTLIAKRRAMSRSFTGNNPQYSPWSTWPIEMAMKTAMHYAISRGWCVIDDISATRALNADVSSDLLVLGNAEPAVAFSSAVSRSDLLADSIAKSDSPEETEQSVAEQPLPLPLPSPLPDEKSADEAIQELGDRLSPVEDPKHGRPFMPRHGEHPDDYVARMEVKVGEAGDQAVLNLIIEAAQECLKSKYLIKPQVEHLCGAAMDQAANV